MLAILKLILYLRVFGSLSCKQTLQDRLRLSVHKTALL